MNACAIFGVSSAACWLVIGIMVGLGVGELVLDLSVAALGVALMVASIDAGEESAK